MEGNYKLVQRLLTVAGHPTKKAKIDRDQSLQRISSSRGRTAKGNNKIASLIPFVISFDCSTQDRQKIRSISLNDGFTVFGTFIL